jgi:hypothetical protein
LVFVTPINYNFSEKGGEAEERVKPGQINPLNAELNTICHFLALLGPHPTLAG